MGRSLVPLNASRAFEAAARRLSFVEAASELHVTPAAISHHVKQLEDFVGTQLFMRRHRAIELTDAGRACYAPIREAILRIEDTILRTRSAHSDGPIRVRVAACLASKWLLPRLDAFHAAHPGTAIEVTVSTQIYSFKFDEMDAIVRLRAGDFNGFEIDPIMEEDIIPVCSPAFLDRHGPIDTPGDFLRLPLIHDDNLSVVPTFPTWPRWFEAAGVHDAKPQGGHRFDSSPMAIDAAIEGRGIALGRSALIADDLDAGRLVPLSSFRYPVTHSYHIIYPSAAVKTRKIIQFRDWLIREARKTSRALRSQDLRGRNLKIYTPQAFV